MHRSPGSRAPRFRAPIAIGSFAALLVTVLPSAGAAAAAQHAPIAVAAQSCAHASTTPTENARAARAATLCLLNHERAAHGLHRLRASAPLAHAARGHSRDMVRRHFFDHTAPGNVTFVDRIRRARYTPRGTWSVAENIAWGTGQLASPLQIVKGWMNSPGHRANILDGRFRSIGIGIAPGVPVSGSAAAGGGTYTTDFGSR